MKSLNWKILFAVGFGAGMLLTALLKFPPNSSSDWATWVQAIGSIGAIGIAIWVSHKQYRDSIKLENDRRKADDLKEIAETRAFVQAIREELGTIWEGYNSQVGPALRATPVGHSFDFIYPAFTEAFTIYNGASFRIGTVPDAELRRLVVGVYARAKGLVYSFQLNNKLLADRNQLDLLYHGVDRAARLNQMHQALVSYATILKERDVEIRALMTALFDRADAWLAEEQNITSEG